MKKTFTLIIILCIALSVFGQQDKVSVFKRGVSQSPTNGNNATAPSFRTTGSSKQRFDSIITPGLSKSKYQYDANNNMTLETGYAWNQATSKWISSDKTIYAYDAAGNITLDEEYSWDNTNQVWVGESKKETVYDANKNLTQEIDYKWDDNNAVWVDDTKDVYTITSNRITQRLSYSWDGANWNQSVKYDYTYDGNNHNTLIQQSFWDGAWETSSKDTYTYDANGNVAEHVSFYWNGVSLDPSYKDDFTYDVNNNMISQITYDWDGSEWNESIKNDIAYDPNNNLTSDSYYEWDAVNSVWKGELKTGYTYDNTYTSSDLIFPAYIKEYFTHKLTSAQLYGYSNGNWVLANNGIAYYTQNITTDTYQATQANGIRVYPNPSAGMVTFSNDKAGAQMSVELYDVQGTLLFSKQIENGHPVSLDAMKKGIYLYRLMNGGPDVYNGTLVLE